MTVGQIYRLTLFCYYGNNKYKKHTKETKFEYQIKYILNKNKIFKYTFLAILIN